MNFDEYPYDRYEDEEDTQLRGGIVSRRKGKVCDKENCRVQTSADCDDCGAAGTRISWVLTVGEKTSGAGKW